MSGLRPLDENQWLGFEEKLMGGIAGILILIFMMKSLKGITVISKSNEADFSNKLLSKTTKVNSEQSLNSIHTSPKSEF